MHRACPGGVEGGGPHAHGQLLTAPKTRRSTWRPFARERGARHDRPWGAGAQGARNGQQEGTGAGDEERGGQRGQEGAGAGDAPKQVGTPPTLPASLSLCRARRTPAPPGVPPQTGRGAHGRGAAPVASPGAAVLLSVCPCLEAPPRTAPVSLRPARDLWPGLERQRGAPSLPGPRAPPPGRAALRGTGTDAGRADTRTHTRPGSRLPEGSRGGGRPVRLAAQPPTSTPRGKENGNQRSDNTKRTRLKLVLTVDYHPQFHSLRVNHSTHPVASFFL